MSDDRARALFNLDVTKKFVLELFKFVASFAILEERLKDELAAKDHSACLKTTMEICAGLKRIYAGELADGFYQTMQQLKNKEHEEIQMYLADFLVYVAMLTVDIQMALFKHDSAKAGISSKATESGVAAKLKLENELILAVDDTMLFLITLKSYVKDTGIKIETYSSAEEALKFLFTRLPALIFLGVDIPKTDMDGFKLASKIRELGHAAPIVFLTGNASEKNVIKAMEMGAAGFIVKPASQKIILQTIEKLIGLPERIETPPETPLTNKKSIGLEPEMPDFPELQGIN